MNKINCDVTNCSHNKSGVCFSNKVDIGGEGANKCCDTCCGSFLDKKLYSTLTNNKNTGGPCDVVVCKVGNCTHNKNTLCNLSSINVTGNGNETNIYSETYCHSFEEK